MRRLPIAILCCAALALVTGFPGTSSGQEESTTQQAACKKAKQVYAPARWHRKHPAKGVDVCPGKSVRERKHYFYLYRHYRQIAPYHCYGGREGYFSVPCYIIACESHGSWTAANPSGAIGPYQLLGWGAPWPARSFRDRVRHHEIAAGLSLSNWVCA